MKLTQELFYMSIGAVILLVGYLLFRTKATKGGAIAIMVIGSAVIGMSLFFLILSYGMSLSPTFPIQ